MFGHYTYVHSLWEHCLLPSVIIVVVSTSCYHCRLLVFFFCRWAVPSPSNLHCIRVFRHAIVANITFSRPGVVVALVLKPNWSGMAVAWQHIRDSVCTSLAILWQSALAAGCNMNESPFKISWSLASSISPPRAPKTSSIGLSGAAWVMVCIGVAGRVIAWALARSSSSSFFLSGRSSRMLVPLGAFQQLFGH